MSRSYVVTNYAFTATDGTVVSTLDSGADWVEQNNNTAVVKVISDLYHVPYTGIADCSYKGTGSGSITANQFVEVTLTGAFGQNDAVGINVLDSGGAYNAFSAYRCYLASLVSSPAVFVDRIVNGTSTNIVSYPLATYGAWATGNKLSIEVTIVAGTPTFQIYQDTGSGPVAYGPSFTDSSGGKLTTGLPGVCGASSADALRGGPWSAGNVIILGAALAGGATSTDTVAGAATTGIKAAAAAATVSTATANLNFLVAAAVATLLGTGALTTAVKLAAAAGVTSTASGTLSGALTIAGAAASTTSLSASLVNYSSVTLTAPLYLGPGGLLDPAAGNWPDSKPQVGSVVFYDGTHLTIASDGQLSGNSNSFVASAFFLDGSGNWAPGTITFTPNMVSYANALDTVQGQLATGIILLGAAQSLLNGVAGLNAQIKLGGVAVTLSAAIGALGSQILLLSTMVDQSTATGVLSGSQQSLAAGAVSQSNMPAFLTAQINLLATAVAVVVAMGNLATQIQAQASALSTSSASGTIQTNVEMTAQAQVATAATAALLTAIRMAGPAISAMVAIGNLHSIINLVAVASDPTVLTGSISANTLVTAGATSLTTATGQLITLIHMNVNMFSDNQVMAQLLAGIPLLTQFESDSTATGVLTATGSPVGLYTADPFFVVGNRRQYMTTEFPAVSPYEKITLTFNFGDELFLGLTLEGVISVNIVASAGVDPTVSQRLLGPAAYDKTLTQVLQPFGNGVMDNDYYFTVTAPTNSGTSLTRFGLLSIRG